MKTRIKERLKPRHYLRFWAMVLVMFAALFLLFGDFSRNMGTVPPALGEKRNFSYEISGRRPLLCVIEGDNAYRYIYLNDSRVRIDTVTAIGNMSAIVAGNLSYATTDGKIWFEDEFERGGARDVEFLLDMALDVNCSEGRIPDDLFTVPKDGVVKIKED